VRTEHSPGVSPQPGNQFGYTGERGDPDGVSCIAMQHAMLGQATDWRKLQKNGAKRKYALPLHGLGFCNPLKIMTRGEKQP
jgi:hypothetical protein